MKTKLFPALQDFTRISLCFLPVIPVIRCLEYLTLRSGHNLPPGSKWLICQGVITDLSVFLALGLALLVPYLLIGLLSRRTAAWIWMILVTLYSLFHFALINYFSATLIPLDQVIFSYTLKEMIMITGSSTTFTFLTILPFLVLLAILLILFISTRRIRPGGWLTAIWVVLCVISPVFILKVHPRPENYERDLQYYMVVNKPYYLFQKCFRYYREGKTDRNSPGAPGRAMLEQFRIYQSNHPEFTFIGPTYPLLHKDETPDVLGPLFNLGDRKPNLVFIIVESLSSAFCGDQPYLGSFTPFLDSLSRHSLYWKNCLTTSERTFYVLPALFASLPYGSGMYLDNLTHSSYHLSLIRYLNNNGYYSRFFYGGDPSFNQMDNFLRRNNTGYILTTWGPGYAAQTKAASGFTWGYPDHEMFRRSFEVMDSMNAGTYLDIYLTLSMHAPFTPPGQERYHARYLRRLDELGLDAAGRAEAGKYSDIYTTILYTDDALRTFFNEYRKRPGFNNTIFFITGDHSLPELNTGWYSPMERFRVPFIIYSPMLKSAKEFQSVLTHLDVTPSVLAMLKNRYGIETHPLAHWISPGMDTTASFRSSRSVVFIRNNKEMVDYVDSGYCLSDGRLYRILPDMKAERISDDPMLSRLKGKLDNYITVTQHVGATNSLVPLWMLFGKNITEQPVTLADQLEYHGEPQSDGYITMIRKLPFTDPFKYISVDILFKFSSGEPDPSRIPDMVFEVADSTGKNQVWNHYPLFAPGEYKPGQWQIVRFHENMDLSYIKDLPSCYMKMYLWNTSGVTVTCDSLVREMKGYK